MYLNIQCTDDEAEKIPASSDEIVKYYGVVGTSPYKN